jgi:hypothetical protein
MSPEVQVFERIVFGVMAQPRLRSMKMPVTACAKLLGELRQRELEVEELREKLRKYEEAEAAATKAA